MPDRFGNLSVFRKLYLSLVMYPAIQAGNKDVTMAVKVLKQLFSMLGIILYFQLHEWVILLKLGFSIFFRESNKLDVMCKHLKTSRFAIGFP